MNRARFRLPVPWCLAAAGIAGLLLGVTAPAAAQGFGASISPPRFELQMQPGQTLRQVIEIQHIGSQPGRFRIYTNDWSFQPDGGVTFTNDLAADSCRPWVAVERRDITVTPNARYRYRFEITAPADAPVRECRFAIMVEGVDPARVEQSGLNIPVGGRIAVIVYASIGGAAPRLSIAAPRVVIVNGQSLPAVEVRNEGNAHGRLEGFLNGTDAAGQKFELSPADLPIMPGETRAISLVPVTDERKATPPIQFPLAVKGTLEWGKNRVPLEHSFTR
jgi:hypothetical protein